jgi:hypothetical protein
MGFCDDRKKGLGRIEFAIACDVTPAFKKAVREAEAWYPIHDRKGRITGEWAEVCFVPNAECTTKKGEPYRYLAMREKLAQPLLPGMDYLPFQTITFNETGYKLFGVVTNIDWEGEKLIHWHHERCGKSEEAHAVLKEDLAGGTLPSGSFGENAAWWSITTMAHNLNAAMERLVLPASWVSKRMKAIRFWLINLPAVVVERSRQLFVRLSEGHPSLKLLVAARQRITELAHVPTG